MAIGGDQKRVIAWRFAGKVEKSGGGTMMERQSLGPSLARYSKMSVGAPNDLAGAGK